MKTLTKAQWNQLDSDLYSYGKIALFADGNRVSLERQAPHLSGRIHFFAFVNGMFCGAWLSTKEPHPYTKYFFLRTKSTWGVYKSKAAYQAFIKQVGVRFAKKINGGNEYPLSFSYHTPTYPSFAAFHSTMIKNCNSIEIYDKEIHFPIQEAADQPTIE
jgi:hypothetical protein